MIMERFTIKVEILTKIIYLDTGSFNYPLAH